MNSCFFESHAKSGLPGQIPRGFPQGTVATDLVPLAASYPEDKFVDALSSVATDLVPLAASYPLPFYRARGYFIAGKTLQSKNGHLPIMVAGGRLYLQAA